jgi:hypothetical protein
MLDELSLPPLSIAGAETHQIAQSFRSTESIPPIKNEHETEQILNDQYNRLQNTLLDSFDEKRKRLEFEVSQTNVVLKRTLEEKTDLGVSLYQSRNNVSLLNRSIAKTKTLLQREVNEKQQVIAEWESSEKEIDVALRQNQVYKRDMEIVRRQLEEGLIKIKQLQEINSNYTSEIKVQKRIHHKLQKEVEISESNVMILQKDLVEERQKNELIVIQKKEVESLLEAQKSETMVAALAIGKMHKGWSLSDARECSVGDSQIFNRKAMGRSNYCHV